MLHLSDWLRWLGGALVGCGSAEEQRALEEAKAIQEQIRLEKYCEAVEFIAAVGPDMTWMFSKSGEEDFHGYAVQMAENAPREDQEKLRLSVDKMLAMDDYIEESVTHGDLWEDVKGGFRSLALDALLDFPFGRSIQDLIDYASSNRCNTN